MALTIQDTIIDEEIRTPATGTADEHDVLLATYTASNFKTSLDALSLTFVTSPTGFPQYAERTSFVSSTNPVTDYFLTSSATGTPFPASGVETDLKVGANTIFLFATSDPNIVIGRIGNGSVADPTGAVALVIGLEETVSGGLVTSADAWIALYAPIVHNGTDLVDNADELDLEDLIHLGSNFTTSTEVPFDNYASVPSGNNAFALVGPTEGSSNVDLLITGFAGSSVGTVNVSTQGLGTNAQMVDEGESLRIDIVDANSADFAKADAPSEVKDESNLSYTGGHKDAISATFEIQQINPTPVVATATVRAYHTSSDASGSGFNAGAISSPGTIVPIDVEDVIILNALDQDITATFLARGGTITSVTDDGVKISGLLVGEQVKFTTDGEAFNRFTVTNSDLTSGPDAWDLGGIKVTVLEGGTGTEYAELGSHLIVQDDGPNIDPSGNSVTALTADETNLLLDPSGSFAGLFGTPDYGADGAGALSYQLGLSASGASSGLTDTATGNAVYLFLDSGAVVGREGTSVLDAQTGDEVFRISVAANGTVTLDQSRAVVHTDANDFDSTSPAITASLITLTANISDSEPDATDDSDSATVNIGDKFLFKDDGPAIAVSTDGLKPNNLEVGNVVGAMDDSLYGLTPGADGLKSFSIVGPADGSGDFTWAYADVDLANGIEQNEIRGFYKGSELYTLELNNDGTYVFKMTGTLPSSTRDLDTNDIKAGGPDTNSIDVGVAEAPGQTPGQYVTIAAGGGAVNESNAFVGVANGNLDVGESLTFTLHQANGTTIPFEGLSIGTKSAQVSTYNWTATVLGGGTLSGTGVSVPKNGTILIDPTGSVLLTSITVEKVSGPATKIGLGDIDILVPPDDAQLGFTVRETDGDNDFVDASFVVDIDGNNDGIFSANTNALSLPGSSVELFRLDDEQQSLMHASVGPDFLI